MATVGDGVSLAKRSDISPMPEYPVMLTQSERPFYAMLHPLEQGIYDSGPFLLG